MGRARRTQHAYSRLVFAAFAVALPGACDSTTHTQNDQFAKVCHADEDCGAGLECVCGVCTGGCEANRDCGALNPRALCATSIPNTNACARSGGVADLHSVCAIECARNDDCRVLGPAAVCSAEWCRRPIAPGVLDGTDTRTCDDRRQQMQKVLAPAMLGADRACSTAADCVVMSIVNDCYGDVCMRLYVSRAGEELLRSVLSKAEAQLCDEVFAAGCAGPGERPSCPLFGEPACVDGLCRETLRGG
jgi:hypothetical protein